MLRGNESHHVVCHAEKHEKRPKYVEKGESVFSPDSSNLLGWLTKIIKYYQEFVNKFCISSNNRLTFDDIIPRKGKTCGGVFNGVHPFY